MPGLLGICDANGLEVSQRHSGHRKQLTWLPLILQPGTRTPPSGPQPFMKGMSRVHWLQRTREKELKLLTLNHLSFAPQATGERISPFGSKVVELGDAFNEASWAMTMVLAPLGGYSTNSWFTKSSHLSTSPKPVVPE